MIDNLQHARDLTRRHATQHERLGNSAGAALGGEADGKPLSAALNRLLDEISELDGTVDRLATKLSDLMPPPEPVNAASGVGTGNTVLGIPDPMSPMTQRVNSANDYVRRLRERIEHLGRSAQV